jgi:hypothetical protein
VVGSGDGAPGRRWSLHFRNMHFSLSHGKISRKVKITVIEISIPRDGDKGAAHEPFHSTGIETRYKLVQVSLEIAGLDQPLAKATERHVGKGEEIVENNPELVLKDLPESCLHLLLRGWEKRAGGV